DTLSGGDGDDTLVGGAGNDSLTGGSGTDQAQFSNSFYYYNLVKDPATSVITITNHVGNEGTDVGAADVEKLIFKDGVYQYGGFTPHDGVSVIGIGYADNFEEEEREAWSNYDTDDTESAFSEFLGRFNGEQVISNSYLLFSGPSQTT